MSKTRILLAGRNIALIDNFFIHLVDDFESLTTSERRNDIQAHLYNLRPDFFLYCPKDEPIEIYNVYNSIVPDVEKLKVPIGILANEKDRNLFRSNCRLIPDIMMDSSLNSAQITAQIKRFLAGDYSDGMSFIPGEEDIHGRVSPAQVKNAKNKAKIDDLKDMSRMLDEAMSNANIISPIRARIRKAANTGPSIDVHANGDRKHVLIIDDDPLMLRAIKEHLKDVYDTATAVSGKVAMRFLSNKTTDLILLDYEMPDEDGAQVLEKLRANPDTRGIPVVFLTGIADTGKIKKILGYRPQGYLLKPINHDKLLKTIEDVFAGKTLL